MDNPADQQSKEPADDEQLCLLCDKPFGGKPVSKVKEKAISSFIAASKKRKDQRHTKLTQIQRGKNIMIVHNSCKSSYVRNTSIETALKARIKNISQARRQSSDATHFDFNNFCFMCGDDASDNFIAYYKKKGIYKGTDRVKIVEKNETGDNIVATVKGRNKNIDEHSNRTWYKEIEGRIKDADLGSVKARYHAGCLTRFYNLRVTNIPGRPADESTTGLIEFMINYVERNPEQCQYSTNELIVEYRKITQSTELFDLRTIRNRLEDYFGTDISTYSYKNDCQFCFINDRNQILRKAWINEIQKTKDSFELKTEIVKSAAKIILNETREKHYEINDYPAPHYFLHNIEEQCPFFLKMFIEMLIKTHKKKSKLDKEKWDKRVLMFSHCLVSSMRPRAFRSPLLLGLSTMLHKKHASRNLIDSLAYLGVCETYAETLWFEDCIVESREQYSLDQSFLQFVFDNCDHNTNTPDGRNTFHATGGIMCATPGKDIVVDTVIKRLKEKSKCFNSDNFGLLKLQHFYRKKVGLNEITLLDVNTINPVPLNPIVTFKDFLWFFGRKTNPDKAVGWNGFMEMCADEQPYQLSKIIPLPFLMTPITEYDAIFTVLCEANARCQDRGQKHTFVTFDLPPFQKAQEIMACTKGTPTESQVSSIILRLGGFHTAMSYAGSIGTIMAGSGLKQAFTQIFAELSAEKALTGHAWSRCFRGHCIVQSSLMNIVLESIDFTADEETLLNEALNSIGTDVWNSIVDRSDFKNILKKCTNALEKIKSNGPTAALWVQYIHMVEVLKQFVEAERTGNWALHLQSVQQMLPYLHAAGHTQYAKYLHLYLQQMLELPKLMDPAEYKQFVEDAYFTIRRTNKFRSGIWSDMTIEQSLMRTFKGPGGMTRGRGITEALLIRYIVSSVALVDIVVKMEDFTNVCYETSEQHVDISRARVNRDAADMKKMDSFFTSHNPFPETEKLISIATGIVGDASIINCYKAHEIGVSAMNDMAGQNFGLMKMTRKNKVKSLQAATCSIKLDNKQTVIVDPAMIFHRILVKIENKDQMKDYLCYELAPFPASIFTETGMRKTNKAEFFKNFKEVSEQPNKNDSIFVIDGGLLLHRVIWNSGSTVQSILIKYVNYVINNYSENSHVVFDGYPDEATTTSTKSVERIRRQNKNLCCDYVINTSTAIPVTQDKFLSNDKNKQQLIDLLCIELETKNIRTDIAEEDADTLIINTAIALCSPDKYVVVVGEDVDLLVVLTHLADENNNILLLKPSRGKIAQKLYSPTSLQKSCLKKSVLFLHAMTGCDTTSCFFNRGKKTLPAMFSANPALQELANVYYDEHADKDTLFENGIKIIRRIYGDSADKTTLNDLRFVKYKAATKLNCVKLEALPPTEAAAREHCLRVYYQIQTWLGNKKDATEWGWELSNNGLKPILTSESLIPQDLLKIINCSCKTGCSTQVCSCRKHGIICNELCSGCQGQSCTNIKEVNLSEALENDEFENVNNEPNDDLTDLLEDEESASVYCEVEMAFDDDDDDDIQQCPITEKRRKIN